MSQRQELPEGLRDQIDDLLRRAGEAVRTKDFATAEPLMLQAWELLPEPKLGWEFYSNIIPRNYATVYRDEKQFDKALEWLEITRKSYGPGRNDSIEFLGATIWLEMGREDLAFEEFDKQYKAFKRRPFQGKDKKYLDFYLARKKK